MSNETKKARILKMLKAGKSIGEVAKAVKAKPGYVYYIRWMDLNKPSKKAGKKPSKIVKAVKEMKQALDVIESKPTYKFGDVIPAREGAPWVDDSKFYNDLVNHPAHYKTGGVETLDFIEAKDLNYRLGNVVKYVSRAGKKDGSDPVQDLEKAAFYLKREIDARKNA
jgi:hypothetical protein